MRTTQFHGIPVAVVLSMRTLLVAFTGLLLLLATTTPLSGAARLTYPIAGTSVAVSWPDNSFPIRYAIDRRLLQSSPDAAFLIDRAFQTWILAESKVAFRSDGLADGLKAGYNGRNTVTLTDDLFADQKYLALTTNWYDNNGLISEVDIQIDGTLFRSEYNVQHAVVHEVGHLLGLDHSGVLTSVMYPFVVKGIDTPVLDSDDRVAIGWIYSRSQKIDTGAMLAGRVVGDTGGIFAAQVVVVNEKGDLVGTTLTQPSGEFEISGIPDGQYRVYAEPLDGPVDTANLAGIWRQAAVKPFPTTFVEGSAIRVETGKIYGNLAVNGWGPTPRLNPRWIGAAGPGSRDFALGSEPLVVRAGQSVAIAVGGDGFVSGMTKFEIMNPSVRRVSEFEYGSNYVYATFTVGPNVETTSTVVVVTSGNDRAMLTGGLRLSSTALSRQRVARR